MTSSDVTRDTATSPVQIGLMPGPNHLLRRMKAPEGLLRSSQELSARLAAVGRNFVASELPVGTPVRTDPTLMTLVSAGTTDHGTTTPSSIDSVFSYLERGAAGTARTSTV